MAVFDEDVGGLEVAVDDAVVVQVADAASERREPLADEFGRQAVGVAVDDLGERLAEDVLHDDPVLAAGVGAEVVEVDEIGVLEVEAVADAAQLGVGVAAEELERDFLAAVADGEVDLAEPALADAPLEGVAVERPLAGAVGELHRGHRRSRGVRSFPSVRMIRLPGGKIEEKNGLCRCADIITGWKREAAGRLGWAENGAAAMARLHPSHPPREGDRKNQRENTKGAKDAKVSVTPPAQNGDAIAPRPQTEGDIHALNEDGMVLCNPRDKEAAHRVQMGEIATGDRTSVTCRKCRELLYKLEQEGGK